MVWLALLTKVTRRAPAEATWPAADGTSGAGDDAATDGAAEARAGDWLAVPEVLAGDLVAEAVRPGIAAIAEVAA
jgi:hypothetical protein